MHFPTLFSKPATAAALRWLFMSGHPAYVAMGVALLKARIAAEVVS